MDLRTEETIGDFPGFLLIYHISHTGHQGGLQPKKIGINFFQKRQEKPSLCDQKIGKDAPST